jgi:hypothetical protein
MKKETRKLNLNRETLAPMQSDDLSQVNGGVTPATTVTTSSGVCISAASATVASAIEAASQMFCKSRFGKC